MPFAFAAEDDKWIELKSMSERLLEYDTQVINNQIYVLGGRDKDKVFTEVNAYDTLTNEWGPKRSMPMQRYAFESVVLDNDIYVMGGTYYKKSGNTNVVTTTNTVFKYNYVTNVWTTVAPMNEARSNFKAVTLDGKIYAIGNSSGSRSTIEEYDPQADIWTEITTIPTPRSKFEVEVFGDQIFIIAGRGLSTLNPESAIEVYDVSTNSWSQKTNMNEPRFDFQSVRIDEKIYVLGGWNKENNFLSSVEEYDINTDAWTLKDNMNQTRQDFQAKAINGKIYALGGVEAGGKILSTAEVYSPSLNTWTNIASMNTTRYHFNSVVAGSFIYVFGGVTDVSNNYLIGVEKYFVSDAIPTLSVTASPNKVKVGNQFTTTVAIHNVNNIYAEDIKIDYDSELFEYVGASAKEGLKIYKEDTSIPGSVRFIVAHLGQGNEATGDKDLIELTFKAKSIGIGKVDIVKGRIADNDTLEMDVAEENCGEDTIEVEANRDVNRTGEYTLLDLGIDAYYYGMEAAQTDNTRFDTDVIPDGIIDDKDLVAITQSILSNSNYALND